MKKYYIFLILITAYFQTSAQTKCADAHSDVIYAYSHVKSAYDANNITHLKHYSQRSLEAFERAKKTLNDCGCEASYNFAYDAHELLQKVETAEIYEDGRFYVKKAREIAKDVINELEICTKLSLEDEALAELEYERLNLEQQQIELKLKEEKLKQKLAEKEALELLIKKEQLIQKNESALSANVNAFNEILEACDCSSEISKIQLNKDDFIKKDLNAIKAHYLTVIKSVTTNYLDKLSDCDN